MTVDCRPKDEHGSHPGLALPLVEDGPLRMVSHHQLLDPPRSVRRDMASPAVVGISLDRAHRHPQEQPDLLPRPVSIMQPSEQGSDTRYRNTALRPGTAAVADADAGLMSRSERVGPPSYTSSLLNGCGRPSWFLTASAVTPSVQSAAWYARSRWRVVETPPCPCLRELEGSPLHG
jgi:hypothetical protein